MSPEKNSSDVIKSEINLATIPAEFRTENMFSLEASQPQQQQQQQRQQQQNMNKL